MAWRRAHHLGEDAKPAGAVQDPNDFTDFKLGTLSLPQHLFLPPSPLPSVVLSLDYSSQFLRAFRSTPILKRKMGSQQNDGTSYPPSEPKPCANNCGFFGTAGTMNLCSKCYRDSQIKEQQAASAKAVMEKSLNHRSVPLPNQTLESDPSAQFLLGIPSSSSSAVLGGDQGQPKAANRCSCCNKKVGLTGFTCKCGSTFCGAHRYPEKHECTYDFKVSGRDAIAKANPVVKAPKLDKI